MKSVFSQKKSQVHLQRNAFDLSHSDIFSIAPGMLLPIHVSEVNPNEHFEITPANYVRTMPLNSAAFTRLKQHIEFFFVPMRTLSVRFNTLEKSSRSKNIKHRQSSLIAVKLGKV